MVTQVEGEEMTRGARHRRRRARPLWTVLVPVVTAGAGLMFAMSAATAKGTDLRSSTGDIPGLIREQTRQNAIAAQRVASLRAEVDRLSARQAPGDRRVTQLTTDANALMPAAGLLAVLFVAGLVLPGSAIGALFSGIGEALIVFVATGATAAFQRGR